MKLLNLCCGANRPKDEFWWNLDHLHDVLLPGTPERANLDSEPRYIDWDIARHPLPWERHSFDGILASHCMEHFDCRQAADIMRDCLEILVPGGVLMVSVPDASYFRLMNSADTIENAQEIFGEPIYLPDMEATFFGYALWNRFHKAILTEDSLWAYFRRAHFQNIVKIGSMFHEDDRLEVKEMHRILNRRLFSLVMIGCK